MTLIEVLVAILIFSFGLLGFVGLQARAIQYSVSAEDTNRAALLANEIGSSMMLANTVDPANPALAGTYATWQKRVSNRRPDDTLDPSLGLPNGTGTVIATGKIATITVTWRAPSAASGTPNAVNRFTTEVLLP